MLPTHPRAPRPGYRRAITAYHLGTLPDARFYRCLCSPEWYRQRRRLAPRYELPPFASAALVTPLAGRADWPALSSAQYGAGVRQCHRCGALGQHFDMWIEDGGFICQDCWEAFCARTWWQMLSGKSDITPLKPLHLVRARYTRPAHANPRLRLVHSRMRPVPLTRFGVYIGLRPRARTLARLSRGTLHFLTARRAAAAQCARRGFERIRPGIWYDRAGDVVYIQTCTVAPAETIRRAVA